MDVLRARSRQADAEHIPETGQEDVYQDTDLMQALDLLDEACSAVRIEAA